VDRRTCQCFVTKGEEGEKVFGRNEFGSATGVCMSFNDFLGCSEGEAVDFKTLVIETN